MQSESPMLTAPILKKPIHSPINLKKRITKLEAQEQGVLETTKSIMKHATVKNQMILKNETNKFCHSTRIKDRKDFSFHFGRQVCSSSFTAPFPNDAIDARLSIVINECDILQKRFERDDKNRRGSTC